jgi:hypothetical protein
MISAASLVRGDNVLAVEVHQSTPGGDGDVVFGATLGCQLLRLFPPPPWRPAHWVSTKSPAGAEWTFQIELLNRGTQPVAAGGYLVRRTGGSPDADYILPPQNIPAGGFLVLNQAMLGFVPIPGDKLFLLLPGGTGVADARRGAQPRSSPVPGWHRRVPDAKTRRRLERANTFASHDEIVFNEIFYHGPPTLEVPATIVPTTNNVLTNIVAL